MQARDSLDGHAHRRVCPLYTAQCILPDVEFRRRQLLLAFRVVQSLSSLTAKHVPALAGLESVGVLIGVLAKKVVLCPVTTFPVEKVPMVAFRSAA